MSTTSCPRCSAQVTLPVGVSNDATVRCPLCHAHYTLADALVNMPPLLEVVTTEDESEPLAADWLDESTPAEEVPVAIAEPAEEPSESETLELGSLELESLEFDDDAPAAALEEHGPGQETVAEDLGLLTVESPVEFAAEIELPAAEEEDALGELGGEELAAGPAAEADELPLDFGGELSAEEASAETMEFSGDPLADFGESEPELKFDLDAADQGDEAATIDFGAPLIAEEQLDEEVNEGQEGELAFDSFDSSEAETVRFEPQATGFGDEEGLTFDDPLAADGSEGEELREFEDIRVEASGDATDIPEAVPVMAVTPVEAEEAPKGKKGKKEKKKKEKKVKEPASGERPRRSLVGILVGIMIAIPAALYGALWLGRDYDLVGLSNYVPGMLLPAEYSKSSVAQNYIPPATPAPSMTPVPAVVDTNDEAAEDSAAETPAEPSAEAAPATEEQGTAHTTARPATDDLAGSATAPADAMADEPPSLAEPAEPAPAAETAAEPAEDLFAPADGTAAKPETDPFAPAAEAAPTEAPATADPFAPAESMPAEQTPAADTPAESDPFAPAADAPSTSDPFAPAADAPAEAPPNDDLFAPAAAEGAAEPAAEKPAEAMPAEAAPAAEDDLFAPSADQPNKEPAPADDPFAPAADQPQAAPAAAPSDDLFAPAEGDSGAPAEMPAESDPFAPAAEPAAAPATTRPAESDPFAPATDKPVEEMPAAEQPVDPLTDKPAGEEVFPAEPAPEPAEMPEPEPAEDVLSLPVEPAMPEPTEAAPAAERAPSLSPARPVGPRSLQEVSPRELAGAMQSTFVANQQLIDAEARADEAALRKARAAFYVNLFGMADAITAAQHGAGAAELDPQLQQLGTMLRQQLAADPRRLEALKVFGARWIGFPKRTTDGVVVSGTVESAKQVGQLFHTTTRMGTGADAPLVTIVSAKDPQLAAGDTVVALGSIVDHPADQIVGYQGNEPAVVWSGMAMKVPAN